MQELASRGSVQWIEPRGLSSTQPASAWQPENPKLFEG
jgi:hypothetical protein